MRVRRFRRFRRVVAASVLAAAAATGAAPASGLPDEAAPAGHQHAHTHGPDGIELDRRGRVSAAEPFEVDAHAAWNAGQYDGAANTVDVKPDAYGLLAQVHAVYVYPSDRASRFSTYAAMFQADARQASKLLADNYGYGVRFDERAGGYLDITVVRSKYSYRQLSGRNQFNLVHDELRTRLGDNSKKYAVWLDADSNYCGQGHLYQDAQRSAANSNDTNRTTAIVYRPYDKSVNDGVTGGFCRGRTLLHEVGHNLGALQDDAPHAFDGAHCNDDDNDAMCYTAQSSFDSGGPIGKFDWNNDDYWDASADVVDSVTAKANLTWWTVNLSKFICPPSGGVPDCAAANQPGVNSPGY